MKHVGIVIVAAALGFGGGFAVARGPATALAASAPLTVQRIDLGALTFADLPATTPPGTLRTETLVVQDGATVGVQIGTVPKHFHADANEIQYVIDGTGTEWLGDEQVALKPGIMLVIPKGTPHGGSIESSGHLKIIAIKTPPQAPGDTHLLP
jgi:mannose-6-phosphate isomerase-like protein (cupin superfamily)